MDIRVCDICRKTTGSSRFIRIERSIGFGGTQFFGARINDETYDLCEECYDSIIKTISQMKQNKSADK